MAQFPSKFGGEWLANWRCGRKAGSSRLKPFGMTSLYFNLTLIKENVIPKRRGSRINRLVWYQSFEVVGNAIARETEIKAWRREKKVALIRENNPTWEDLGAGWGERVELKLCGNASEKQVPHGKAVRNDIALYYNNSRIMTLEF
jgi:hypothetical protein